MKIYSESDELLASHDYIDTHAYVSMYSNEKTKKIKFAIYYEPDKYFDSMDPPIHVINDVEKLLKTEYFKSHSVNMSYRNFLRSIIFKNVGSMIIENDTQW